MISLLFAGVIGCAPGTDDQKELAVAALFLVKAPLVVPSEFTPSANAALSAWDIGLGRVIPTAGRSILGAYNPANYMAVTNDDCVDPGIPSDLRGTNCPFQATDAGPSHVIGVCQTRLYRGTNRIADSTLVIRKSFQTSGATTAQRQAVWTHEVGHCLGLQHTNTTSNIMYPYAVDSAQAPSPAELAAVKSAYAPLDEVSDSTGAAFFTRVSAGYSRHYALPSFYLAGAAGPDDHAAMTADPEDMVLESPVVTINHYYNADEQGNLIL